MKIQFALEFKNTEKNSGPKERAEKWWVHNQTQLSRLFSAFCLPFVDMSFGSSSGLLRAAPKLRLFEVRVGRRMENCKMSFTIFYWLLLVYRLLALLIVRPTALSPLLLLLRLPPLSLVSLLDLPRFLLSRSDFSAVLLNLNAFWLLPPLICAKELRNTRLKVRSGPGRRKEEASYRIHYFVVQLWASFGAMISRFFWKMSW